eukprot:CAMPEP_0169481458 /NCGR_PEP_ID=MMETSP1042-20121227/30130_1 /TAXON_ID=464988 /ORGANISM="Hemiselmis andersenii, Strain CCMP1180" /LENGTH=53 /DNA_ID=CAMNT_0009596215 /DNA_START=227 /DNA_END=385 /DNA_ORIENTATION=-
MSGILSWLTGGDMPKDVKGCQTAIHELIKERDAMKRRIAELEGEKGFRGKTVM